MTIRRTLLNALAAMGRVEVQVPIVEELSLTCSDGTVLAAQRFVGNDNNNLGTDGDIIKCNDGKNSHGPNNTILCVHGWMDNCRSFHHLAPTLASRLGGDFQIVALDLPGHGLSSHKSVDAPPMVQAELSYYLSEAIHVLGITADEASTSSVDTADSTASNCTLIGHSLGAGISSLYAAAFPEKISKLILLDGAGFLAREEKDTALHVRRHVEHRQKSQSLTNHKNKKEPRIYPSLERAIQTRQLSASRMPGKQTISYQAAKELVERGTVAASHDSGIYFRHDSRFAWPSIQYMTWAQNEGIFQAIKADVCLLIAENGFPFKTQHMERTLELLQPKMFRSLPGSHYFHADPETADAVVESILEFLCNKEYSQ